MPSCSGRASVRIVCWVASLITMNFKQKPLPLLALLMLAPAASDPCWVSALQASAAPVS